MIPAVSVVGQAPRPIQRATISLGRLEVDLDSHTVRVDGERRCVGLMARGKQHPGHGLAVEVLIALIQSAGVLITRDDLAMVCGKPRSVDPILSQIRRGVGDAIEIRSHYGRGWTVHAREGA